MEKIQKQKRVLITGGKGDIAIALKVELERKGYFIFNPDRKELNITDKKSVCSFIKKNNIDVLINNAGFIYPQDIKNLYIEKVEIEFDVNVIAPFFLSSLVLKKNPKAKIVNIGSTSGLKGRPGWGGYSASKAGLISLTETLQAEGYDAYVFNPRRTATKMRRSLFPDEDVKTLESPVVVAKKIIIKASL